MYKAAVIFLFYSFTLNKAEEIRYEKIFSSDFANGLNYLNIHSKQFTQSATKYNNQPQLLSTIVFPELMRYSIIRDVLETSGLELMYIKGGSNVADFSIGRFQMKPSFAEDIETEIADGGLLNNEFEQLTYSQAITIEQRRKDRIARLQNINWQLIYLNAFVCICNKKFSEEVFTSVEDSLSFYASAYNTGFTKTAEEIRKNIDAHYYPYGTKYKGKQYSYASVACYFNTYTFSKCKISPTLK